MSSDQPGASRERDMQLLHEMLQQLGFPNRMDILQEQVRLLEGRVLTLTAELDTARREAEAE